MKVKLIKDCKIAGINYKKGTDIQVTNELGMSLVNNGRAESETYKKEKKLNLKTT